MKKLSLKKLKLESSDLLQRNELKTVFGGEYNECQALVNGQLYFGLSVSTAQSFYNQGVSGGYGDNSAYCCASCSEKSWAI